jgi:ABC-type sugar transport system substrate-binding protein
MRRTMHTRRRWLLAAACGGLMLARVRAADARPVRLVIIPKLVGIDYYDAVKKGIDDAARELPDVQVTWTGPTQDKVEKQIEIIDPTSSPSRPTTRSPSCPRCSARRRPASMR